VAERSRPGVVGEIEETRPAVSFHLTRAEEGHHNLFVTDLTFNL
jgi:hypothetical protein